MTRAQTSLRLASILRGGVWIGSGLLIAGTSLGLARGELRPGLGIGQPGLNALANDLHLDASSILRAGLLLIIATPLVRVVIAGWLLGRQRDRLAIGCTVAVLALLTLAVALDLRKL